MSFAEKQLGQYTKLCGMRKGEPFIVIPPYKFTFLFSFLLLNAISSVLFLQMKNYPEVTVFSIVHMVILIYVDILWLSTSLINPGLVLKSSHDQYGCKNCAENIEDQFQMITPVQSHCKKCRICIEGRQHHCSLVGGCVGQGNTISYHFWILGMVIYGIDFICTVPFIYYLE